MHQTEARSALPHEIFLHLFQLFQEHFTVCLSSNRKCDNRHLGTRGVENSRKIETNGSAGAGLRTESRVMSNQSRDPFDVSAYLPKSAHEHPATDSHSLDNDGEGPWRYAWKMARAELRAFKGVCCLTVGIFANIFLASPLMTELVAPAQAQEIPKSLEQGGTDAALKQRRNTWTVGVAGGQLSGIRRYGAVGRLRVFPHSKEDPQSRAQNSLHQSLARLRDARPRGRRHQNRPLPTCTRSASSPQRNIRR